MHEAESADHGHGGRAAGVDVRIGDGTRAAATAAAVDGPWVQLVGGRLVYGRDGDGNRVPDFSYAGYRLSAAPIPEAPQVVAVAARTTGDDTARIQAALDQLAGRSEPGAVVLGAGTFRLGAALQIRNHNVVLRGSGASSSGTVLDGAAMTGPAIVVGGAVGEIVRTGSPIAITTSYVPTGATQFDVASTTGLTVGQEILVCRPHEADWLHEIGMDAIPDRPDGTPSAPWPASSATAFVGLQFRRRITAVSGTTVTVDVPLCNAIEREWTSGEVWRFEQSGRLRTVGVERLKIVNVTGKAIELAGVTDGWVRDVLTTGITEPVFVGKAASRVTIADCTFTACVTTSAAPPYAVGVSGQLVLVRNVRVTGKKIHAFGTVNGYTAGPNVFTRCTATADAGSVTDSSTHQRWSVGVLFDQLTTNGTIDIQDPSWMGSGHGWSGANCVIWNSSCASYTFEEPPTAYNWSFGVRGTRTAPKAGHVAGEVVSPGTALLPASLYDQQLADRA